MANFNFAVTEPVVDLPPDLLQEIGRAVVQFAYLEWYLSRFAYALAGVDRIIGRIAVREPRASDRFDMVCELLDYRKFKSKADLTGIRKRIVECESSRNLLAHSTWVCDPIHHAFRAVKISGQWQPTAAHPRKTKRKVSPEAVPFEADEGRELNEKLKRLLKDIVRWANEFEPPKT